MKLVSQAKAAKVGMASTARWGLKQTNLGLSRACQPCRNGLYSPLGIETVLVKIPLDLHYRVGMASTARWGLKQEIISALMFQNLFVGMASTARWRVATNSLVEVPY